MKKFKHDSATEIKSQNNIRLIKTFGKTVNYFAACSDKYRSRLLFSSLETDV